MEDFLRSMTMKDIGTSLISADQFVTLFNGGKPFCWIFAILLRHACGACRLPLKSL